MLIGQGLSPEVRIIKLNEIAISQMRSLLGVKQIKDIKKQGED